MALITSKSYKALRLPSTIPAKLMNQVLLQIYDIHRDHRTSDT